MHDIHRGGSGGERSGRDDTRVETKRVRVLPRLVPHGACDAAIATMSTTSETLPVTAALGRSALLIPLFLVVAVLFATGRDSASDLALAIPFLAIPIAIFVLRYRAR